MINISFKRLFEVQVLHDFFLTTSDGDSYFDKREVEKEELLLQKQLNNIYDVRNLVDITPTEETKNNLSAYNLKFAKTTLGFIIGTEVTTENKAGKTLYKPKLELPKKLNFAFHIQVKYNAFNAITNLSLHSKLPTKYYFTNKDKIEFVESSRPKSTSLPLAGEASKFKVDTNYEMGAIIDFGRGIYEALKYTSNRNTRNWERINYKRFVTQTDKILLPNTFNYVLDKDKTVKKIDLILEDSKGIVIKKITESSKKNIESLRVNLSRIDDTNPNSKRIPSGSYLLKIKEDSKKEDVYPIYLSDDLYDANMLGAIDIRMDEEDSPYSLLTSKGYLKTSIQSSGTLIPHPVFELRFKNRRTYWRYNKEGGFSSKEVRAVQPHLTHSKNTLVSVRPKALTKTIVPFKANRRTLTLPQPENTYIKLQDNQIFSEIFISQSNRLLNS